MACDKDIIENIEEFYNFGIEYYNNIDKDYREECLIISKSIAV